MLGHYEVGRTLGEGSFGKVKLGRDTRSGRDVAIKILDKGLIKKRNMAKQIKKEISVLKMIRHPSVVELIEVLASDQKIFLVLELVNGGELFSHIVEKGRLSESMARTYFRQLIQGVEYCHAQGICHRDLKPENLLLDDTARLKISDFGLSAFIAEDTILHTTCGTPNYVAPEVLMHYGYAGEPADVWSTGVILYVLLAGFLPFDEPNHSELFRKISHAKLSYPKWFSKGAVSLINLILNPDQETRITVAGIKAHPWYTGDYGNGAVGSYDGSEHIPGQTPDVADEQHRSLSAAAVTDSGAVEDEQVTIEPLVPGSGDVERAITYLDCDASMSGTSGDAAFSELARSRSDSGGSSVGVAGGDGGDSGPGAATPRAHKVNAFDLINMVGHAAMHRMFDKNGENALVSTSGSAADSSGGSQKDGSMTEPHAAVASVGSLPGGRRLSNSFTQFSTPLPLEDILSLVIAILDGKDADLEPQTSDFELRASISVSLAEDEATREDSYADDRSFVDVEERMHLAFRVRFYSVTSSLQMVEFIKEKGENVHFYELYEDIKHRVQEQEKKLE